MAPKRGTKKKGDEAPVPSDRVEVDDRDTLIVKLSERVAFLENELLSTREDLQTKQEELEVQAEELEAHLEELHVTNEELEKEVLVRQQSEKALRKSQYILAKSQEMAHVGNWAWNLQTGEMNWSDESFSIFGHSPQAFVPDREWLVSCVYPGDRSLLFDMIKDVIRDGRKRDADVRAVLPDGAVRYVNVLADKVVRDNAGTVSRVYGIFQDVTERRRAGDAIRENEQRLKRSQGIAHLGSWELDLATDRLSWSDEVYRIFGLQPQEFNATYEAFLAAVHPDDRAAVDAAYSGSIRDGKDTYEIEHRIIRSPNGEIRIVHEKCEHFRDDSGRIVRSVGMVHDITERKRLEEALKEREKQLAARLNALLSPGNVGEKAISEIVDLPSLQEMADSFQTMTGVANAIIDLNGAVLVGSGWQDICTKFHRCHPDTCKNCIESDLHLSGSVEEGKYAVYKCKNGMWDAVTPIVVNGNHIANLFTGQFFFEDEVPDYDYFKRQAEKYGFNKDEYLAALRKVPRHSREKVGKVMDFYTRFAAMVSQLSYSNVQLAQSLIKQKESEQALQEKMEEIEVQAEEIEVQNEELRANNEELEALTRILRQREIELSRLAAIVMSSDDAIIGKTLDGTITSWNAGAEKIYGYTAAEALGCPIDILIPPWLSGERDLLEKIGQGQRVVHHETQRLTKDGRLIDASITISPIFDGAGTLIGASTIARDVTEARKAENALKKSRFIMAKSQEIAHVGNWAWNVQTGEMNGSDENYRIYGYQPHEVCPTEDWLMTLVHAADQTSFSSFIESVRRDGMRGSIDYRIVKPDGDMRYLMTVADRIIRDKAGKIKWVYGITQDITGRKQTEEALKEAKTQAELYLDLMGHDISNMHQIALSQLELAEEIMKDEGKIGVDEIEMIATPIETLNRSARLIDNVRKIQKLRAGEYRTETVDLGKVLGEVVAEGRVPENGVTINYTPVGGCLVKANPLIKEAFANLVNNAIKHSHGRPTIDVGVSTASGNGSAFCQITITDDGPGIPDEKKGEIFHRFKRGQTQAKGTGLGLYIVKTLVENFKGRVRVEDRVPGDYTKGSKFIVDLPVAEE